jgi:hypothetical protein
MFIAVVVVSACNNNKESNKTDSKIIDTSGSQNQTMNSPQSNGGTSINGILSAYLQLKNALADDKGKAAASAGKLITDEMNKIDTITLSPEQKNIYKQLEEDIRENAEHIGDNAGKIDHQREHFEMLSQDIYDLVKAFGTTQKLYKDFCPMYNDGKGASWLSESKEIKNPYMGEKMPSCGLVKEEINK